MARKNIMVPYGFEPSEEKFSKGTLIVYDSFENIEEEEVVKIIKISEDKNFDSVVFYPLHDSTLKRMGLSTAGSYHKRVKKIESIIKSLDPNVPTAIDKWEGKRSKYTPIITSLSFLMEKYSAPYFVYMSAETANAFSKYSTFSGLIRKIRLLISNVNDSTLTNELKEYRHRWDIV